jgi:hypothetical protein
MMDGAHYRGRAEQARAEAGRATFPDVKRQLLRMAEQYDALARQADDLAANRPPKSN